MGQTCNAFSNNSNEECPEIPLESFRDNGITEVAVVAEGVRQCVVGYSGGSKADPTYKHIKDHTEAVLIEFDPKIISYEEILSIWKTKVSPSRPSFNRQYRSAIFYLNEKQKDQALQVIDDFQRKQIGKVHLDVEYCSSFYMAEEYHQNFILKRQSPKW